MSSTGQVTESVADLVERLAVEDDGARPLLVQLRRACHGDIGGTAAGASSGAPIPIDPVAVDLWRVIVEGDDDHVGIRDLYQSVTSRRSSGSAVVDLLAWSISFHAALGRGDIGEAAVEVAVGRLRGWVESIRALFDPRWKAPLRGFACPLCGRSRVVVESSGLEVEGDAVVVTVEDGELVARCRNRAELCEGRWVGDHEVIYMARQGGIDVEAIADALRGARAATPESAPAVEEERKVLVEGDPGADEVLAELRARRATRVIVAAARMTTALLRASELQRDGFTVVQTVTPRSLDRVRGVVADRLELVHDRLTAEDEARLREAVAQCFLTPPRPYTDELLYGGAR